MKDDRVQDGAGLQARGGEAGVAGPAALRVAAVVVTYNRLAQLQVTLARLLAEAIDHVLVVDNASDDGTADWLASRDDPRLRVLRLPENTGGAGGFEAGLGAVSRDVDPDWTVLMDDDARPKAGALAAFRAAAAGIDPDARAPDARAPDARTREAPGGIAAAVVFPDGRICEMNRPSRNPFWHLPELIRTLTGRGHRGFHLRDAQLKPAAPPSPIDVASFVGLFVSRGAVARAGLPEGGLFIYGDDVIYSLRLRRAGVGLALHPAVRFEHDCASLGVGLVTRPMWKVYYLSRNGVALARMAAGWWLFPVALGWYLVAWSRKARHYAAEERPLYRALLWQGVWDGLLGRRGRNAAVHDRVARDERKAALLQGGWEVERPALMTTSVSGPVSAPDRPAGPQSSAPQSSAPRAAALATTPPALKAVSAPPRLPPLAVPRPTGPGTPPATQPPATLPAAKPAGPRTRPLAQPARRRPRHLGLLGAFAGLVLLPVLASTGYLYLRAVDQYASTLGFTVRSEDISSAVDILGGLGAGLGGGTGSRDSDILYEFIRSQELVGLVDRRLDLRALYAQRRATDPLLSFDPDGTIEDLTDYWQRMVRISYDASSGLMELRVLAFAPQDAKAIAEAIYEESSKMINDLSAIAREDATRYAREDLDQAIERLKVAREALTAFRVKNQIVDLTADIQGQMGLLNTLQSQLAAALIESDLLIEVAPPGDPRLVQAERRIKVIEARIEEERQKFGGTGPGPSGENYAVTVADFERLTVDREFAERAYIAALSAYDGARAEANRQSRYLAAYIRPTQAEKSEFPQRGLIIGLVALFSFLTWAILALVYYSLRDRR